MVCNIHEIRLSINERLEKINLSNMEISPYPLVSLSNRNNIGIMINI